MDTDRCAFLARAAYTTGQVAALLGVSRATVRRAITTGALRAHTMPGSRHRRIAHGWLKLYLEATPEHAATLDMLERAEYLLWLQTLA